MYVCRKNNSRVMESNRNAKYMLFFNFLVIGSIFLLDISLSIINVIAYTRSQKLIRCSMLLCYYLFSKY